MMYIVIERFRGGCAEAVYRRFADQGRMLPDGVQCIESWVSENLEQCFQLMGCDDDRLLDTWMQKWCDLIEFEVVPVISSEDAAAKVFGHTPD